MADTLETLVDRLLAANVRADRVELFPLLVREISSPERVMAAFVRLLRGGGDGPKLGLELAARLPDPIPADLVRAVVPMLSAKPIPPAIRIAAAAKVLAAVPDRPEFITPVVRGIAKGLSKVKALERLNRLQARVAKCDSLDIAVAAADRRVKFQCPKCPARLVRSEFIGHLWEKHHLVFQDGKACDPQPMVEAAITAAATSPKPADLDRAFLLSRHYYPAVTARQVFQALAARGTGDPTQTDLLLERAAADRAGLCPVCLTPVPDPIPPLVPEANLAAGRVSAEGFSVELIETPTGRALRIEKPESTDDRIADPGPRWSPRRTATGIAAPVLATGALAVALVPASPWLSAAVAVALGWLTYAAVRSIRKPLPKPTRRVLELTWSEVVPGLIKSKAAVRFLARLCRASLQVGDPVRRAEVVHDLAASAGKRTEKSPAHQQFFALARVLEVDDLSRIDLDRVTGLSNVFGPFFRGEVSPAFAEAAAEVIRTDLNLAEGDRERLAILLVGMAFENGFVPADLNLIARFLPHFRMLAFDYRPEHLAQLHAVWRLRGARSWESVGPAETVFDLARNDAAIARRLLKEKPDALWLLEFRKEVEDVLGAVVVTPAGLFLRGTTAVEPDLELVRTKAGANALRIGKKAVALAGKLSPRMVEQLNDWLRYRGTKILPIAEHSARTPPTGKAAELLAPLAVNCPICGTLCVHRSGRLGTPWQAIVG